MPALNHALIKRVQEQIDAHPRHFDMNQWLTPPYGECQTTACIAGWALVTAQGLDEALKFHNNQALPNLARRLLGLPSHKLFYKSQWPPFFQEAIALAPEDNISIVASALLQAVLDTNGAVLTTDTAAYNAEYPALLEAAENRQAKEETIYDLKLRSPRARPRPY